MPETTTTNLNHARGVLEAASDDRITLGVPGTSYQLHLKVLRAPSTPIGKRIVGTIRASARRVDRVNSGGRFIEPVMGRPRRIQGRIEGVDSTNHTITVHAGVPIVCTLMKGQHDAGFAVGDFVGFDVEPGASFTYGG